MITAIPPDWWLEKHRATIAAQPAQNLQRKMERGQGRGPVPASAVCPGCGVHKSKSARYCYRCERKK